MRVGTTSSPLAPGPMISIGCNKKMIGLFLSGGNAAIEAGPRERHLPLTRTDVLREHSQHDPCLMTLASSECDLAGCWPVPRFPETSQQEIGWIQARTALGPWLCLALLGLSWKGNCGKPAQRSAPAGSERVTQKPSSFWTAYWCSWFLTEANPFGRRLVDEGPAPAD